jgi:hypothetical protein
VELFNSIVRFESINSRTKSAVFPLSDFKMVKFWKLFVSDIYRKIIRNYSEFRLVFGSFSCQKFIGKISENIQNFAWFSEAFRIRTLSENYLIFKRFFWQKSNKYRKVFIYFVSEKHPILVRKRRRLFGKCSHRNRIRQKSIRHILSRVRFISSLSFNG